MPGACLEPQAQGELALSVWTWHRGNHVLKDCLWLGKWILEDRVGFDPLRGHFFFSLK